MAKKTKLKLTTGTALIVAVIVLIIIVAFGATGQTAKFFAPGGTFAPKPGTFTVTHCGNNKCEANLGENLQTCPQDCAVCGDGVCTPPKENANACFVDCGCGNGNCDANMGENLQTCQRDCAVCGDGACSGPSETPDNCIKDCPPTCGNGVCNNVEKIANGIVTEDALTTKWACPADCLWIFGDGVCSAGEAKDAANDAPWWIDCASCGNGVCEPSEFKDSISLKAQKFCLNNPSICEVCAADCK